MFLTVYSRVGVKSYEDLDLKDLNPFYPTALKGREIVCPGCISETVRCRKLILGRDIG